MCEQEWFAQFGFDDLFSGCVYVCGYTTVPLANFGSVGLPYRGRYSELGCDQVQALRRAPLLFFGGEGKV